MSIRRAPRPESGFYTLDKRISEDQRLSWAARGLLIFLLGKPDHWEVSVKHLIAQTEGAAGKSSGRDAVRVILKELEQVGYLRVDLARSQGGSFNGMDYTVSEIPFLPPKTERPAPVRPETENPAPVEPAPGNPHQVNTDSQQGLIAEEKTEDSLVDGSVAAPTPDELFDRFWAAYPRKVKKDEARKAFHKRKPDQALTTTMCDAIAAQAKSEDWTKDQGQFIPHPTTWLNQGRWQDEVKPTRLSSRSAVTSQQRSFKHVDYGRSMGVPADWVDDGAAQGQKQEKHS